MFEPNDLVIHDLLGQAIVVTNTPKGVEINLLTAQGSTGTHVVSESSLRRIGSVTTDIMNKKKYKARVDELVDKDMVAEDQGKNMKAMIDSPDNENFDLAQELIALKIEEKLIEVLNDGQTKAFIDIASFFKERAHDALVLKGYAGTGKTFLVNKIIEYIISRFPNRRIAITAPTNKAVQVLKQSGLFNPDSEHQSVFEDLFQSSDRVEYKTIHSLLGLREMINDAGVQSFVSGKKEKSELSHFKYLIVDEVSMLDDYLCKEILKQSDRVNIIFMGDPAQIPPINRTDCIPFTEEAEYNFKRVMLDEIMRQKTGNPIVKTSFQIRENLTKAQPIPVLETELTDDGDGVVHIHSTEERHRVREILAEYFICDQFKADANYAKVLAWRNKTVNYMNDTIREMMYGKQADPYVIGEKLICNKPVFKLGRNKWGKAWVIQFNTSQEFEVIDVAEVYHQFSEGMHSLNAKVYECQVRFKDVEGKTAEAAIRIIRAESIGEWKSLLNSAKKTAIAARQASAWVVYYNILKWSANVGYNYAITCHKSQGSTYQNVLLIEEDIDHNRKTVERNRIKYTAYTRSAKKLYVLRKNHE